MPRQAGRPRKIDQMDRALGGKGMTETLARYLDAEGYTIREIGVRLTERTAIPIGKGTVRAILRGHTNGAQSKEAQA